MEPVETLLQKKLDTIDLAKACQVIVGAYGERLFVGQPFTVALVPREDGSFYAGVLVGMCVADDPKHALELLHRELSKLAERIK